MNRVSKIVFFLIVGELILGGGGRFIAFGPITLRMILFAIAMIFTASYFFKGMRISRTLTIFLIAFSLSLVLALTVGIFSGAEWRFWLEDIKPLSYILILPFFSFIVEDHYVSKAVSQLIVKGGVVLSIAFFVILALIHSGLIPFLSFYNLVLDTGEFFFRAETTFFYKGFIYVCIALIFAFFVNDRFRLPLLCLFTFAIILTFTRGFIFALAVTYAFYFFLEKKYGQVALGIALVILTVYFSKPIIYTASSGLHELKGLDQHVPKERLLGNREESDIGRIQQAKEVASQITPLSFFIGHGFGIGVPSRPVHMEVSYLEIFHKQGIVGLAVWGYLFYLLFVNYRGSSQDKYAKAFYFSACFIFFQSITNQFINNPIGLSFALLALTYLHSESSMLSGVNQQKRKLSRHQKGDEISLTSL